MKRAAVNRVVKGMERTRGFTLIELMIVLAILAVLAAWGIPSFQDMIASNRLVTNVNNLVSAFQLARNEAITRARPIDVTSKGGDWLTGWEVKDGDTVLMDWGPMVGNVDAVALRAADSYRFNAQGNLDVTDPLFLCDSRTGETGRLLELSRVGRVSVTQQACD